MERKQGAGVCGIGVVTWKYELRNLQVVVVRMRWASMEGWWCGSSTGLATVLEARSLFTVDGIWVCGFILCEYRAVCLVEEGLRLILGSSSCRAIDCCLKILETLEFAFSWARIAVKEFVNHFLGLVDSSGTAV